MFFTTYFPAAFSRPFCKDHLRVIERLQNCVLHGGLFALAMPRGSGKTTMCERTAIWALLYGHRRFVALVAATQALAEQMLGRIKRELEANDALLAGFRSVCYPIRRLENNARRAVGQLFRGQQTRIEWSTGRLVLPTVPDEACEGVNASGFVVTAAGLTGALRGQAHTLPSGEVIRPELVLLDDVQTRESAMSVAQTAERLAIINGDVLGMAGPGQKIAAVCPCTVIREGDLSDQLLNRELNPQWQGERTRAVYSWPTDEESWDQYLRIRSEGLRTGAGTGEATRFYRERRAAMDAGAVVAWPERHYEDELSAVQHVINLRADLGEAAFAAEYQNEPLQAAAEEVLVPTAAQIAAKVSGLPRGTLPLDAAHLVAFVDVHDSLLFWAATAWAADFTGQVVDYGTWPEQRRWHFTLRKASPTLADVAPGAGREGAVRAGLDRLVAALCEREWPVEGGRVARVERLLVDSGFLPDVVYEACRRSPHAAAILPSRGVGVGASARPFSEYQRKPGERHGPNWLIGHAPSRAARYVRFDANAWKTFLHARLAAAPGDRGGLSLFGRGPEEHRLFAEHLTAETPTRVSAKGRTVDEWRMRPGVADNHWLDCLVGCCVAASTLGAALPAAAASAPARPKLTLAELQKRAKEKQGRR
ncbi:MAG TPA: terminase gpA endonuclease subunit [Gemmataceae bacterium]|nr:terminase gpA endonuclease subunit [Gemmataceae bacterium]